MTGELNDRIVIVTGASRGIGKALAFGLAAQGAAVVCAARTVTDDPGGLPGTIHATASAIEHAGGRALALRCDVGRADDLRTLVDRTVQRFGRVDVLVNNAMAPTRCPFDALSLDGWDESMAANVRSLFILATLVVPFMTAQGGGSIVNISSGGADHAATAAMPPGFLAYSVAKAAMERFTTALAPEVAARGIAINALRPGAVKTELATRELGDGFDWTGWTTPEAVVAPVAWLAGQIATGYTGRIVDASDFGLDMAVSVEKIRIAVVGAGFGARIQVPGLRASGRFEVVALVGRDPDRLARAAARCGVERTCRSLEEALAIPGLRAVSVTTPPAAHADGVVAAARAGLHVLCEKPMARTAAEAEAMCDAARDVVALVDHEFRFDPARAMLARLIQQGDLGTPQLVTAITTMPLYVNPWRPPPAWWFDADLGGGWLGACGSHWIDALRVWLGEITDVTALVDARAPAPAGVARQADDTYTLLFRTRDGAQGVLQQSAATWGGRFEALRIAGSEATCWIEGGRLERAGRDGQATVIAIPDDLRLPEVATAPWMGPFAAGELPAFVRQAEHFADLIDGVPSPRPGPATFTDGVACQRIMDAARAASASGGWIRL